MTTIKPIGLQALGSFLNRAISQPLAPLTEPHAGVARSLSEIVGSLGDRQSGYGQASRQLKDADKPKRVAAGMKAVFGWLKTGNARVSEAIAGAVRLEPELNDDAFLQEARLGSSLQERLSRLFSSGMLKGGQAVFPPAVASNLSEDLSYLQEFGILDLVLNREPPDIFPEEWISVLPESLQASIRSSGSVTITRDEVKALHERVLAALAKKDASRATALLASMDWLFAHKPKGQGGPYLDLFNLYSELCLRVSNEMPQEPIFVGANLRREMVEALRRQDFVRAQNIFLGMMKAGPKEGFMIMDLEGVMHPFVRLQLLKFYLGYTTLSAEHPGLREGLLARELRIALLSANTRSLFELTCLAWINGWLTELGELRRVRVITENTLYYIGKLLPGMDTPGYDFRAEDLRTDAVHIDQDLSEGPLPGIPEEVRLLIERRDMRGITHEALDAIGHAMEGHRKDGATLEKYRGVFLLAYNTVDDPFLRTRAHELLERFFRLGITLEFANPSTDAVVDQMKARYLADPMRTLFYIHLTILCRSDPKISLSQRILRERLRGRWED